MAARFWVGGTGTWDASDTTHWAATSGGAGGQTVPGSGDSATFDASSGGGTVTVDTTVNLVSGSITFGAFTGTLDFATNNNDVTCGAVSGTGTGVRTFNAGSGTWTINGVGGSNVWNFATVTNLTADVNDCAIVFAGNGSAQFSGGGLTYGTLTLNAVTNGFAFILTGNNTFATWNVTAPRNMHLGSGSTQTVTNPINWTGTSTDRILVESGNAATNMTIANDSPAISWVVMRGVTWTGTDGSATDTVDLGGNSGITITAPSGGGVVARVIGG